MKTKTFKCWAIDFTMVKTLETSHLMLFTSRKRAQEFNKGSIAKGKVMKVVIKEVK